MLGALARDGANVLHAPGQRVALALQLRQAEQTRPAEHLSGEVARGVGRDVRKPAGDDL